MSPRVANYNDRLADYVDVKERIRLFYEKYPDGRLVTTEVRATAEPDGVPRVWVEAAAYRTPDDPLPGRGWSWLILPGSTPYTKGSELENTETSSWGRAIGALGIGISASIASQDEIDAKAGEEGRQTVEATDDGGLIGLAVAQGAQDFEIRQSPDGFTLPFRLRQGNRALIVIARDALAEQLHAHKPDVIGKRVTVWGRIDEESFRKDGKKITYHVLSLERLKTPDLTLPAAPSEPEPVEAESVPLFDELDAVAEGLRHERQGTPGVGLRRLTTARRSTPASASREEAA
jgi:hypothetical protein